jgi:hypothetical protein
MLEEPKSCSGTTGCERTLRGKPRGTIAIDVRATKWPRSPHSAQHPCSQTSKNEATSEPSTPPSLFVSASTEPTSQASKKLCTS